MTETRSLQDMLDEDGRDYGEDVAWAAVREMLEVNSGQGCGVENGLAWKSMLCALTVLHWAPPCTAGLRSTTEAAAPSQRDPRPLRCQEERCPRQLKGRCRSDDWVHSAR